MALRLLVAAFAAALVLVIAASGSTGTVSAHEHRTVAENYEFVVGWTGEPAIGSQPNAVDLRITFFAAGVPEEQEEGEEAEGEAVEGEPVVGAEETLNVTVSTGGGAASTEVNLEPAFGEEGAYEGGPIIPTQPGDYTFVITGTLPDGTEVNETFESGPETFSTIEDPATLMFPQPEDAGDSSDSSESSSDDDSDTAMIIAIIAAILAVVAGGIGIFAISRSRAA
jgi:hypothetical protein